MKLKMIKQCKIIIATIALLIFSNVNIAQDSLDVDVNAKNFASETKVGELLKSGEKMTAVIIVISILLVGLFLYLYRLDKKIEKLK